MNQCYSLNLEKLKNQRLSSFDKNSIYIPPKFKSINYEENENITLNQIIEHTSPILITSKQGYGKTTLSKKLEQIIWENAKSQPIIPLIINRQTQYFKDLKSILKSEFNLLNEEQIQCLLNDEHIKLIIIIDDFDQIYLEVKDFIQNLKHSNLIQKCQIIYFINSQNSINMELQDFFQAETNLKQYEIIKQDKVYAVNYFEQILKGNEFSTKILSEDENEELLNQLTVKYQDFENIERLLINIIKLSSYIDDFEQEAGNAMLILKGLKKIIRNEDFSQIRLKNSSFNEISFQKCNFEKSIMNNVDITYCWFIECNLNLVLWQNMKRNEQQILLCHNSQIRTIDTNTKNRVVAVGLEDQMIQLWDIKAGKKISSNVCHIDKLNCVAFSSNVPLLASCSNDGCLKIWNCDSNKKIRVFSQSSIQINTTVFSPNGNIIASGGSDFSIQLWNVQTGHKLSSLLGHKKTIQQIIFTPEGNQLASCSNESTILIWNVRQGNQYKVLNYDQERFSCIAFSPNQKYLASGGEDCVVIVWDVLKGTVLQKLIDHDGKIKTVQFSPDGKYLATAGTGQEILIWTVDEANDESNCSVNFSHEVSNQILKDEENLQVNSIKFINDGQSFICANSDGTIRQWGLHKQQKLFENEECQDNIFVSSVAFSPDGKILASSCSDYTIRLWNLETGKLMHSLVLHTNAVLDATFSFDGQILASCGKDKKTMLWNVKTGEFMFSLRGHTKDIRSVVFSPIDNILATGSSDRTIILWNLQDKTQLNQLIRHKRAINQIRYSSCGQFLASCGEEVTVYLWNAKQGKTIFEFHHHTKVVNSVSFSKDGKILASGSDDATIILWDVQKGGLIQIINCLSSVFCLEFSQIENFIVSGHEDQLVVLWNISNSNEPIFLKGHRQKIQAISFSRDGKMLAACSENSTIRLWNIESLSSNVDRKITPLYIFSNEFPFLTSSSSMKNASIFSEDGSNLHHLFNQCDIQR